MNTTTESLRVCILGNPQSVHVRRLTQALGDTGCSVQVVGTGDPSGLGVDVEFHNLGAHRLGGLDERQTASPASSRCGARVLRRARDLVFRSPTLGPLAGVLIALVRGLRGKVRTAKADIVYAQYLTAYGLWTLVVPGRVALAAWGSDVLVDCRRSRTVRTLVRIALRRAALVTYDSNEVRTALQALGAREDRLVRLDFGVDRAQFDVELLPPTQRAPMIVSLRSLDRDSYRVREAILAFAIVLEQRSGVTLVVANDGRLRMGLEKLVDKLGIAEHVRFVGYVSDAEVRALLRAARIYVSIPVSDGTSASLLEALAAGCFPIVSDLAANREWIVDDETGSLVDGSSTDAVGAAILFALQRDDLNAVAEKNRRVIRDRADFEDHIARLVSRLEGVIR